MFARGIAILFLFIFLIKLINPKTIPALKEVWAFLKSFFITLISYVSKSFVMAGYLLMKQTVYVVGTALMASAFLSCLVFLIATFPHYSLASFWSFIKKSWLDLYVLSFFLTAYVLGLIEVLKHKNVRIRERLKGYFRGFTFTIPGRNSSSRSHTKTKGRYVYDEETKEYRYEEQD